MLAPDQTIPDLTLPAVDVRALVRRAAVPALIAGAVIGCALLVGGRVHAVTDILRRGFGQGPAWAAGAIALESASLAAYVWLLSLVAGRATPRIGARESAQITLAGAAATRLLPTAGAGGAALTLWALRRAGMKPAAAVRTLLTFLVALYAVFLATVVISGGMLALGLAHSRGPVTLSAIPALVALLGIAASLALAFAPGRGVVGTDARRDRRSRAARAGELLGAAVRDACRLVRSGDPRLAGAIGYWAFDAAVLWAMLHVFGASPAIPVVALAYFVGQVSNTVPIPGSVSGGMTGVLVAFGIPLEAALPSVLAYRTLAVWLPLPVAIAAVPGLRASVARWEREDRAAVGSAPAHEHRRDIPLPRRSGTSSQVTVTPLMQTIPTTVPVPGCPGLGP